MKHRRIAVTLFLCLLAAGVFALLWRVMGLGEGKTRKPIPARSETKPGELAGTSFPRPPATGRISDQEFDTLRFTLPRPERAAWQGPLFDSANFLDPDKADLALRVLPIWIRKALQEGRAEQAAVWLGSFLEFLEHPDAKLRASAALSLYRMGDSDDRALLAMRSLLFAESPPLLVDNIRRSGAPTDARAMVLSHLALYNDTRLLGDVRSAWNALQRNNMENPAAVDMAFYLESNGVTLPEAYWLQRLETPAAFANALSVLEKRRPADLSDTLARHFEETKGLTSPPVARVQAPMLAATLLRLTGETAYENYLVELARIQMAKGESETSSLAIMQGLVSSRNPAVDTLLEDILRTGEAGIKEAAVSAMGQSAEPRYIASIAIAAERKAGTQTFPRIELEALLQQRSPAADLAYEKLKTQLSTAPFGWNASDFDDLEFFRRQSRDLPGIP